MRKSGLIALLLLALVVVGGCGRKRVKLNPGTPQNMAVLFKDGNLSDQTVDQKRELDIVMKWMAKDLQKSLKRSGFNAVLIQERKKYEGSMGMLFIVDVNDFEAGNRAARAFVGFGAGAASLDLNYKLLKENGKTLLTWKDGVGSSKGGTYCAQTLNQHAIEKLVTHLNNN